MYSNTVMEIIYTVNAYLLIIFIIIYNIYIYNNKYNT